MSSRFCVGGRHQEIPGRSAEVKHIECAVDQDRGRRVAIDDKSARDAGCIGRVDGGTVRRFQRVAAAADSDRQLQLGVRRLAAGAKYLPFPGYRCEHIAVLADGLRTTQKQMPMRFQGKAKQRQYLVLQHGFEINQKIAAAYDVES